MRETGIIIYPYKYFAIEEVKLYINLAKKYNFKHVLATFFAVDEDEIPNPIYLEKIKAIGDYCRQQGLEFQADLFPTVFEAVGATIYDVQPLLDLGITEFRMDYGFDMKDLAIISKNKDVRKIILNATTAAEQPDKFDIEIQQYIEEGGIVEKLEASHNVNPHPHTGLSIKQMQNIREKLNEYHIPISAFVPASEYTYGIYDVWESCPSVEDHRYWAAYESAQELWAADVADTLYVGDFLTSEKELKKLSEIRDSDYIQLRVRPSYDLTLAEQRILFSKPLKNRLAAYVLRFTEFRNTSIFPQNCVDVKQYDVTIDNQTIKRYNGEVRIALTDQPKDPRVNVVGHLHPHDVRLLSYIKATDMIQFILDEKE